MLALLLTAGLLAQEPEKPPVPAPAPSPAPAPAPAPAETPAAAKPAERPVEVWDDATAKAAVASWTKQKDATSLTERNRALEAFAGGSNKALVKPLAQVVENDKSLIVRRRAATLLGNQPPADANATLRKLLKNPKVDAHATVVADLVRAIAKCGYTKANWADIEGQFERDYHADRVPVQEAVLDLVIAHKEKQAIPVLLRNLDEPAPVDVRAAENPPAEYWEARWKAWHSWRGKVKEALFVITGQRFSTAAEATEWLKKNPLK